MLTELFEHLTKDGLPAGEIRRVEDAITILTPGGTFVVQRREVTDPEALAQMKIPGCETVVRSPRLRSSSYWRNRVELISSAKRNHLFETFAQDAFHPELFEPAGRRSRNGEMRID